MLAHLRPSVHIHHISDVTDKSCLHPSAWGCITWDSDSLWASPPTPSDFSPATGEGADSSHASAQLDGVFIITTESGTDRGGDDRVVGAMGENGGEGGRAGGWIEEGERERAVGRWEVSTEGTVPRLPQWPSVSPAHMRVCRITDPKRQKVKLGR